MHEHFKECEFYLTLPRVDKKYYNTEKGFICKIKENYFWEELYCMQKLINGKNHRNDLLVYIEKDISTDVEEER